MIRLVIDNTRSSSSPFLTFISTRGMPSYAAHSLIDTLRDLSVDLARRGRPEAEIRAEMTSSANFMVDQLFSNFFTAAELRQMVRLLGIEIDRLVALALPLKAVPQDPAEKPAPKADPLPGDIIDVEFEEVDAFDLGNDPSAILYARAA